MNRKYQLKQTLRQNLYNNNKNNEFIICDYNSTDGLYNYIVSNFKKNLILVILNIIIIKWNIGTLVYVKTQHI